MFPVGDAVFVSMAVDDVRRQRRSAETTRGELFPSEALCPVAMMLAGSAAVVLADGGVESGWGWEGGEGSRSAVVDGMVCRVLVVLVVLVRR